MNEKQDSGDAPDIPLQLPLFLTDDLVIFPGVLSPVLVQEKEQIDLINEVLDTENKLLTVALRKAVGQRTKKSQKPYSVGCVALIVRMARIPDGSVRLLLQGLGRVSIDGMETTKDGFSIARLTHLKAKPAEGMRIEALVRNLKEEFSEIIDKAQYLPSEVKVALINISQPGALADYIASNLNVKPEERQEILSAVEIEDRLTKVSRLVARELEIIRLGSKIQDEVSSTIEHNQKEYFLREQLKAIRRELGEDQEGAEVKELKERLAKFDAPEKVMEAAEREIDRLSRMNPSSADYNVGRTYIDWLFDLPWHVSTKDKLDVVEAKRILDRDHYGLNDVKERILEYLAVKKLKPDGRASILCFIGPPGVGKTSIGQSIASAMGRKFQRMSLGGLRDEAEIRGHRRTYIGALPGRIILNLKRAGSNNPVFMLDEIDKLGNDFRGDPASAMLEVLDPEQNFAFQDNYLELDFDLSNVMFITTANYLETIPSPLLDRMELIKLSGYITPEKVQIARRYLVPRQIEQNGLSSKRIKFTDKCLENIVVYYTREAGVRTLERTIGKVCRKVAVEVSTGVRKRFNISTRNLQEYLGAPWIMPDLFHRKPLVGIATGLAWTAGGGVMLNIEAISMPGEGRITITGRLGEVMMESAIIGMSLLKSRADRLKIPQGYFRKHDFHLHIPEGATPKDGPSAGITITTALASLFTGKPIRHDVAMTGEITLEGRVLPIGGLREKSVAAARGHMRMVICPSDNRSDLDEIPDIIKEKLEFKFVNDIDEVLKIMLLPQKKRKR